MPYAQQVTRAISLLLLHRSVSNATESGYLLRSFSKEYEMKETVASPLPIRLEANVFWGLIFLLAGSISFLWFFCVPMLLRYYCLLVPLTLPILVVAVYLHWLSMKLFKHA